MNGSYKISIKNSRNKYSFELKRNITLLRGASGRGKTTLYDLIYEYNRFAKSSGVSVSCDRKLIAVDGDFWRETITANPGAIIVIDEDSKFIRSKEFARVVRGSDNYYLLITRNYLAELPVSVDEIYELTGSKNKSFRKVFSEIDRMYNNPSARSLPFIPEIIVTEDGRSGYQYFKHEAERLGIQCVSAEGKTKIFKVISQYSDRNVVVVADGAAFGSEISDIVEQQELRPRKLAVFLPESFEWLILKSGVVQGVDNVKIEKPESYADSVKYMSWEQYFTDLLIEATMHVNYMAYRKNRLPDYYMQERISKQIRDEIKGIKL